MRKTSGGTVHAGREETIREGQETVEEALNKVLPAAKSVVEKLRSVGSKPNKIEVTFGINLSIQAGAFIASETAQANFGVTVRWTEAAASKETASAEGNT